MALIYREDFAAGNSLFTSMYHYDRPDDGVDPLYPYMRSQEGGYINGDGMYDKDPSYTGEFETYQQTGFWVKGAGGLTGGGAGIWAGSGFWDGTQGYMEVLYHPTTESLASVTQEFVQAPLITLVNPAGSGRWVGVTAQFDDALLVVHHQNEGSHDGDFELIGAPMPVAGQPYLVRMEWRCGTWANVLDPVSEDGFVRLWINGELVYEATNISLYFTPFTIPPNRADSLLIGYFGLMGPCEYFEFYDSPVPPDSPIQFASGGVEMPIPWIEITFKEVP